MPTYLGKYNFFNFSHIFTNIYCAKKGKKKIILYTSIFTNVSKNIWVIVVNIYSLNINVYKNNPVSKG